MLVQEASKVDLSVSKTVQIVVVAINDAPSIKGPVAITAMEDVPMAVTGITVEDPDCDDALRGVLEIEIAASNGTVQLVGSLAGLYLMEALPGAVKIRGKTAPVNAALAGLSYVGAPEFSGEDILVVSADDLGNSGTGGRLRASMSIHIMLEASNDSPHISAPPELDLPGGGVLFVAEDQSTPLGNFVISDPDDAFLRVTVSARVGIVGTNGNDNNNTLIVMKNDETGTRSSITFEGAWEEIDAALASLRYTSSLNWNSVANGRDVVEVSRDCCCIRHFG